MSQNTTMHSRDRLIHTAAKVGFLAELLSAVDVKQFLISDDGMFGLVEFLRHIQGEIQTAEAALQ
jgi:hypothetical protein